MLRQSFSWKVHSGTFSIVTFRRPSDAIFQSVNTISQEEQHLVGTCGALAYLRVNKWGMMFLTRFAKHVPGLLVSQALPFAERGTVWSRYTDYRVVAEERNYRPLQLGNIICWHSLNTLWRNCTPWQRMRSTKSADLIGHIKFLSCRQLAWWDWLSSPGLKHFTLSY